MCNEYIHVPKVGVAPPKFWGVLRAPVAEPPLSKFLNPPQFTIRSIATRTTARSEGVGFVWPIPAEKGYVISKKKTCVLNFDPCYGRWCIREF